MPFLAFGVTHYSITDPDAARCTCARSQACLHLYLRFLCGRKRADLGTSNRADATIVHLDDPHAEEIRGNCYHVRPETTVRHRSRFKPDAQGCHRTPLGEGWIISSQATREDRHRTARPCRSPSRMALPAPAFRPVAGQSGLYRRVSRFGYSAPADQTTIPDGRAKRRRSPAYESAWSCEVRKIASPAPRRVA